MAIYQRLQPSLIVNGFLSVLLIFLALRLYNIPPTKQLRASTVHISVPTSNNTAWTFSPARDAENYGLSDWQCATAFPKQYADIDLMVSRRKQNPITAAELETHNLHGAKVKAMIYDGSLYILSDQGLREPFSRGMATAHSLHRALMAYPDRKSLPNCEFVLFTQDHARFQGPVWGYAKMERPDETGEDYEDVWLMPDFGFWSWPETKVGAYGEVRRKMGEIDDAVPFDEKMKKLVWRGTKFRGHEIREMFLEVTRAKEWADVREIDWEDPKSVRRDVLPLEEYCRYMFTGHVEGLGWSGGGKYVHNCNSVFVTHRIFWKESWHGALVAEGPEQNVVIGDKDWSGLEDTIVNLKAHPEVARRIAENSGSTLRDRYLTPAAEACYWRRLISGYASVSYEPDFLDAKGKWRGVPFESVALMGKVQWDVS